MYDSQEDWFRRLYWHIAKEKKNDQKIDDLFSQLKLGNIHAAKRTKTVAF